MVKLKTSLASYIMNNDFGRTIATKVGVSRCTRRYFRVSLLLGIISVLLIFYWLTRSIPKREFSMDEHNTWRQRLRGTRANITATNAIKRRLNTTEGLTKSNRHVTTGSARLHLIIQFPVFNTSGRADDNVTKRQMEYTFCLQRNLLSPHVERIHILCESDKDPVFIKAQNVSEDRKINFHLLGRRMRYKDAFQYASNHLLHRNVMIMNADCYVDKGFEQLDEEILNNKTMYALTRHETPENVRLCTATDFCGPNAKFIGSYDAFLFRLLVPVPSLVLDKLDYRPNILGIETVLIFYFQKHGGFRMKNPCRILHIVHNHCSTKRNKEERTIQGRRLDHYLGITEALLKFHLPSFSGL